MNVLILSTRPPRQTAHDRWHWEYDLSAAVEGVLEVLPEAVAHQVDGEPSEILEILRRTKPDCVVNLCEAPMGCPELESRPAELFEWLRIPFTGSGSLALELCRRKDLTRAVLAHAGVPIPRAEGFPCIVKPSDEDGSAGIHADSLCHNAAELERALGRLTRPLVEEFLPGREFAVSLWGALGPEYAAIGEILFMNGVRLQTYTGKWDTDSQEYMSTPLIYHHDNGDPLLLTAIENAKAAWRATGLRGYASIDLRVNSEGVPCVLDVNPNPAINPGVRVHRAALESGWTWAQFMQKQLEWATF